MVRAVLEGVAFGLRDCFELVRALGVAAREVRASGGGAASAVWRQILADVFACPISTVNATEGAAYGAALLAGVGAGVYASVEQACEKIIRRKEDIRPGADAKIYAAMYDRYRALYPALKAEFAALAAVK
jgi:xylulokinase